MGLIVHRKVGDAVSAGEPLFTVHANDEVKLASAEKRLLGAVEWSDTPVKPLPRWHRSWHAIRGAAARLRSAWLRLIHRVDHRLGAGGR